MQKKDEEEPYDIDKPIKLVKTNEKTDQKNRR